MLLWKKSVGERRIDCSSVMALDVRRHTGPEPLR